MRDERYGTREAIEDGGRIDALAAEPVSRLVQGPKLRDGGRVSGRVDLRLLEGRAAGMDK